MVRIPRFILSPRHWLAGVLALALVASLRAATMEELTATLFRPLQAEMVALSPDGKQVAYTRNEKGELAIYLMAVERPEKKFKISVESDRPVQFSREKAPARLRFMRWASPTRLVFAPSEYYVVSPIASIFAVNSDGTEAKTIAESGDFAIMLPAPPESNRPPVSIYRRTVIHGFRQGDRNTLLVEALGLPPIQESQFPTEMYAVDIRTGKKKSLLEEYALGRYFYDPSGNVRLFYNQPRYDTKRTYELKVPGRWDRWTDLNAAWGGSVAKTFVVTTENYFGERAYPLGVDADPNLVYYASNIGRDTLAVYALNLQTKERGVLAVEDPHVDLAPLAPETANTALVLDEFTGKLAGIRATGVAPFTRWVDAQLAEVQRELDFKFSQRTVEIVQWDQARTRFLIRTSGGLEAGRYFVFQRPEKAFVEILRSAPWMRTADLHTGTTFEFDVPGGGHLTGYLTFPRQPRLNPPPLLIDFSDGVMGRARPGFDREAQMLAEMGFVVARINVRGMSGFGLAHREPVRTAPDTVPVADAVATVQWIVSRYPVDRRRVATIGRGMGGYLALRALQLEPEVFRCGIAIDAPLAPVAWLQPPMPYMGRGADSPATSGMGPPPRPPPAPPIDFLQESQREFLLAKKPKLVSVTSEAGQLTRPVMLVVNTSTGEIAAQNASLNSRLKRLGRAPTYYEAESPEARDLPGGRAKVYRRMEEFFNLNLYDFNVKIGPTKEVK